MAHIKHKLGRREIFFSDHALDRYWQRHLDDDPTAGRQECRERLRVEMETATWDRMPPVWSRMSRWHAARCEGVILLDNDHCFVINRNASGDLVAVTFLINQKEALYA
jgi:hypothetical protein